MELSVTQNLEFEQKQTGKLHFTTKGLLNSRYKRIVKYNFEKKCRKSVFGIRQRAKSPKLCNLSNVTSAVLKISVFVAAAIILVS